MSGDLATHLQDVLHRAPDGWDRSLILTEDRDLGALTATLMDVRYVMDEGDPEADVTVERVQEKRLIPRDELARSIAPEGVLRFALETMNANLLGEHDRRPA